MYLPRLPLVSIPSLLYADSSHTPLGLCKRYSQKHLVACNDWLIDEHPPRLVPLEVSNSSIRHSHTFPYLKPTTYGLKDSVATTLHFYEATYILYYIERDFANLSNRD